MRAHDFINPSESEIVLQDEGVSFSRFIKNLLYLFCASSSKCQCSKLPVDQKK